MIVSFLLLPLAFLSLTILLCCQIIGCWQYGFVLSVMKIIARCSFVRSLCRGFYVRLSMESMIVQIRILCPLLGIAGLLSLSITTFLLLNLIFLVMNFGSLSPRSLMLLSILAVFLTSCAPAKTTVKAVSNAENTVISVTISGNTNGGTSSVDVRPSIDSNQVVIKPYVP